jgi:hypothetical protein
MSRFSIGILAIAVGVCGCDSNKPPAYTSVSGTVELDGRPLEKGTIAFTTDGRPPSVMDIVDGRFVGQAMVGSNKVTISSKRKKASAAAKNPGTAAIIEGYKKMQEQRAAQGGGGGGGSYDTSAMDMEEIIPKDYSGDSKQIRVVEAGGQNKFDFLIKSGK